MLNKYRLISGTVFGAIALLQLVRAIYQWPVQIDSFNVPIWLSWLAAVVAGVLCVWAFNSKPNKL